ncbi:MAG TPA: histidine kinase N-terminal 7TM domain-containing protein [Thermomicrobiales bacterium]|nr:histidine kinase N-terminal 7TM domain-containing protein [Thermomicrobiales bacterium]
MNLFWIVPDFLIAVLATWLGAGVLARTPRYQVSRVFALLTLLLALWSTAQIGEYLTGADGVRRTLHGCEATAAALLPAALLHLVLAFTQGRRWGRPQRAALILAYALGAVVAVLSLTDRQHPIAVRPPNRSLAGLPGPTVGWLWIGVRACILGLAVWWVWRAWRAEGQQGARRDQLTVLFAAVVCGAVGGVFEIVLPQVGLPDPFGAVLIASGLGLAAYAAIAQRAFLAPGLARRTFFYSLGAGVVTAVYVGLLLGLEKLARRVLDIDAPVVTGLALVLTIALFDPVRQRVRALLDRGLPRRDLAYRRLLRALGDELLTTQRPETAIGPALTQLCRALRIRDAAIFAPGGEPLATFGLRPPATATTGALLVLPLAASDQTFGQLVLGPKRNRLPYSERETDLLANAAAFVATSLQLAERQASQAAALDALTQERAALLAQRDTLAQALSEVAPPAPDPAASTRALHVHALGPLRVERDGEPVRQWGGAKAGTRQAEAVFAFLFDRGERGAAKDEFLDVIWPDVDIEKADLAFHRTLGGLRRTLEPDLKRGSEATAISYHNDRYRLDPALIAWSDVAAFSEQLAAARLAADPAAALAALEEARALYRGDYLDDCPFYGDSEYVEERRTLLRGQFVDLLLALGERYEARDDTPAAAACYREALQTTGDDCLRAEAGLARLGRVNQPGGRVSKAGD